MDVAENADEAMTCLERMPPQYYDVGILDMHMPDVDGLHLAQQIAESEDHQDMPLVMLSSVDLDLEQRHTRRNIISSVTKPVRQAQLFECLCAALAHQSVKPFDDVNGALKAGDMPKIVAEDGERGSVLLVEDNPVNQAVAETMLEELGFAVMLATNGKEALDAINVNVYDAILMDWQMPVMGGDEATKAIRQMESIDPAREHTPIIGLTANAISGDREKCLAIGMDDYLSKPFTLKQLSDVLESWLGCSC